MERSKRKSLKVRFPHFFLNEMTKKQGTEHLPGICASTRQKRHLQPPLFRRIFAPQKT